MNPAQFRRITKRTEITVPCVMARQSEEGEWKGALLTDGETLPGSRWLAQTTYTHWLPFQWPEVRG